MIGRFLQGSHLILSFSLLGCFQIMIQLYQQLLVCLDFLFIHNLVLVGYIFLGIYPFLLCYLLCWCIIFHNNPMLLLFSFFGLIYSVSCLISDYEASLFFSLTSVNKGLSILFILSNNQHFILNSFIFLLFFYSLLFIL